MNTIAIFKIIFRVGGEINCFILISLISLTVGLGCTNLLVTFLLFTSITSNSSARPPSHLRTATRLSDGRRCKKYPTSMRNTAETK